MANPTSPTLSDLASAKTHIGLSPTDTTEDASLASWLLQAEAMVRRWCRQDLAVPARSYTEYPATHGTPTLLLRQRPVTSVTSVHYDPAGFWGQGGATFPAATLLTEGVDYALRPDGAEGDSGSSRSGTLVRLNGTWPGAFLRTRGLLAREAAPGRGVIKVVYEAGFAEAPPDLELAVNLVVANLRMLRLGAPTNSESYDGYSFSLSRGKRPTNPLEPALDLLWPYRRLA